MPGDFSHVPESEELAKGLFGGKLLGGAFPLAAEDVVEKGPAWLTSNIQRQGPPNGGGGDDWGNMTLEEAEQRIASEDGSEVDVTGAGPAGGDEEPMARPEPTPETPPMEPMQEGATTIGQFLASTLHAGFTLAADRVFGAGYLTQEERIALSTAAARAMQAFDQAMEQEHPQLRERTIPTAVALASSNL